MYLRKLVTCLSIVILTGSILTACGGGSDSSTDTNTGVIIAPAPVTLTSERQGQSVARMWNEVI